MLDIKIYNKVLKIKEMCHSVGYPTVYDNGRKAVHSIIAPNHTRCRVYTRGRKRAHVSSQAAYLCLC